MKQAKFLVLTAIVLCIIGFSSCNKDTAPVYNPTVSMTVNDLVADTIQGYDPSTGQPIGASNKFTFYSLERNQIVADTATATWDLGFKGTKIITNGGTSGNKLGGAFVQVGTFAGITSVSADSVFAVDNGSSYAIPYGNNKGWYTLTPPPPAASIVVPIAGRILIVRTASGKYAKLEILNYYKGGVTPSSATPTSERYYKFQFAYQADGTKNF